MRHPLLRYWEEPLFSLFCVLLLGSACSSSTDEQRAITSTPQDYCQQACQKAHACADAIDASECRSSCQTKLLAKPKLRGDFLAYVGTCIDSSACSAASASKCKNEANAQLAPSKYGQTLCAAYVAAGTICDDSGATYPSELCFEAAKSYDDSALQAANDCLAQSCADLGACLAQAIPDVTLPH